MKNKNITAYNLFKDKLKHTYATIISPFLEKAGIALNMVESP